MAVVEEHDDELSQIGFLFILVSGLLALIISVVVYTRWDANKAREKNEESSSSKNTSDAESDDGAKTSKKVQEKNVFRGKTKKAVKDTFSHPFLLTSLRAHVAAVLDIDFSSNGKYLVSVCEDRQLMLWNSKTFTSNVHNPSIHHVELDTATRVAFSPDSKSLIVALKRENKVAAFKIIKSSDGGPTKSLKLLPVESPGFETNSNHILDISQIGIACTGKYLISASSDNKVVVYDLHGQVFGVIEPKLSTLYHAAISLDGRFVGVSGFTPDVFVHEVIFTREGSFKQIKKAFVLKGHSSGVFSFCFNQNSSRVVTVSKDGTWKLFNTDIRYDLGEEAKQIAEGEWRILKSCAPSAVNIAMSPSGKSFVISANNSILFVSTLALEKTLPPVEEIHQAPIASVRISPCGRYVATCGDRWIRIFNNVTEYYSNVVELEQSLKEAHGDVAKQRVKESLNFVKAELKKVLGRNGEL